MGKRVLREKWIFAFIVFLPIIFMAGFRKDTIGDTGAYRIAFDKIPNSFSALLDYLPEITKDKGFTVLSGIIKVVFGENAVIYFLILAAIQGIILVSVYRKYSANYLMSVFLFVVSTDYLSWMFNGLRQFTAVTIIFAATSLMIKKKWVPTILLILLASTMHQSALLMIPIYIIALGKAWNSRTILFLIAALVAVLFVDQFTDVLDNMMQNTQYENMVSDWVNWGDDGTNALRVAVYSIPTILSIIGFKYIREENDPVINFCANMAIVTTGLYIVSMFTSGIFMGRLPIYASLYNYILLPWIINRIFTRRTAYFLYAVMIVAYIVFYIYQIRFTWGIM
ncbi:MAG: EpsG family protein [Agathobacter sp.]